MRDPTRQEMLEFLNGHAFNPEFIDEFEREEAIYWFAANWHSGQSSNLYEALCQSPYRPGPLTNKPSNENLLLALETEYGNE